jgi:hypothetical protein
LKSQPSLDVNQLPVADVSQAYSRRPWYFWVASTGTLVSALVVDIIAVILACVVVPEHVPGYLGAVSVVELIEVVVLP